MVSDWTGPKATIKRILFTTGHSESLTITLTAIITPIHPGLGVPVTSIDVLAVEIQTTITLQCKKRKTLNSFQYITFFFKLVL